MVENGNAKRAKSGNGKCCCVVSTIVIVAALAVGAFIYRENIVEEIEKLRSGSVDENYKSDSTTDRYWSTHTEGTDQSKISTTENRQETEKVKDTTTEYDMYTDHSEDLDDSKDYLPDEYYEEYDEELTTLGNDNLSGKVLINSQEDINVSDQSEVDSNESVSFENKINQKNLSISHISDIFQTMFNTRENDSDEDDFELINIRSTTRTVPVVGFPYVDVYDGSGSSDGSGSRDNAFKKSRTNKTLETDDEDY